MTTVVIIADRGAEMARLTAHVHAARGMTLVRHASGRVPVARIVADHRPSVVLLGEMSPRRLVRERLAEVRRSSPESAVIVVPGGMSAKALEIVLHEVLDSNTSGAPALAQAA
jgi:chemotaxis response regulator CheB